MLDKITISSVWGPVQERHFKRLAQVSYHRFSQAKTKQTTTYINSPLTGKQIDVVYIVKTVAGQDMGYVEITIPVASALIGHNYFHAGLEVLRYEIQCLELLVKVLLVTIGMEPEEIQRYMTNARILLCELTWHTEAASMDARIACQRRTGDFMRMKRKASSRHDEKVADAQIIESKTGFSLKVMLKTDDAFRQYCKAEQIKVRRRKARADNFLPEAIRPKMAGMLPRLARQVRNELLAGEKTLKHAGILHPRNMYPKAVETAMAQIWHDLGFNDAAVQEPDFASLNASAKETLQRYMAGENVTKNLPAYRVSRDRNAIRAAGGPNIAGGRSRLRFKPENLGYQLQYARRWKLPDELRDLVVSERTAPAIMEELQQGLDFITDGVLPDIADAIQFAAWRQRWMAFVNTEHLGNQLAGIGDGTDSWASPEAPALQAQPGAADPADVPQPLLQPAISRIRAAHRFGRSISTVIVNVSDDDGFDPHMTGYD